MFLGTFVASCASQHVGTSNSENGAEAYAQIDRALPRNVADRSGWANDIYASLTSQQIAPTHENICAVVAVIEQESGFQANPVIPGLPAIAWKEIHARAEHAGVPWMIVHGALDLKSTGGVTYAERIDHARTEKDLSDIYEDFIGSVPLGRTLFADHNPVRTRGPMQVNVAFVRQSAARKSYPYPVKDDIADELFTRRGSIYFGVAHLLGYQAPYPHYLYRFADYNAGQYASRNAAFQSALSVAAGVPVTPDGALVPGDAFGTGATAGAGGVGSTAAAVRELNSRLQIDDDSAQSALAEGKSAQFEHTALYKRVFALADRAQGHPLPHAVLPRIKLQGPKISRNLTTEWYARRVNDRFQGCLKK
jgi:hypothetical protein